MSNEDKKDDSKFFGERLTQTLSLSAATASLIWFGSSVYESQKTIVLLTERLAVLRTEFNDTKSKAEKENLDLRNRLESIHERVNNIWWKLSQINLKDTFPPPSVPFRIPENSGDPSKEPPTFRQDGGRR